MFGAYHRLDLKFWSLGVFKLPELQGWIFLISKWQYWSNYFFSKYPHLLMMPFPTSIAVWSRKFECWGKVTNNFRFWNHHYVCWKLWMYLKMFAFWWFLYWTKSDEIAFTCAMLSYAPMLLLAYLPPYAQTSIGLYFPILVLSIFHLYSPCFFLFCFRSSHLNLVVS